MSLTPIVNITFEALKIKITLKKTPSELSRKDLALFFGLTNRIYEELKQDQKRELEIEIYRQLVSETGKNLMEYILNK